jgi:hypothetical protein
MNAQEIRDLFKRHSLSLSRDDVWEVRPGSPVIKHAPLERLAAVIGVEWGPPQILRSEREEAVLIATGKIGDGQPEWSIGEAVIGQNYKVSGKMAAYPYAMAEKRAKDRVILKLAGLHGAYSEAEADDFKQEAKPEPKSEEKADGEKAEMNAKQIYMSQSLSYIEEFKSAPALLEWAKAARQHVWPVYGIEAHDPDGQKFVKAYKDRMAELEKGKGEAA